MIMLKKKKKKKKKVDNDPRYDSGAQLLQSYRLDLEDRE